MVSWKPRSPGMRLTGSRIGEVIARAKRKWPKEAGKGAVELLLAA